jgi:hypothetical protein
MFSFILFCNECPFKCHKASHFHSSILKWNGLEFLNRDSWKRMRHLGWNVTARCYWSHQSCWQGAYVAEAVSGSMCWTRYNLRTSVRGLNLTSPLWTSADETCVKQTTKLSIYSATADMNREQLRKTDRGNSIFRRSYVADRQRDEDIWNEHSLLHRKR